MSPEVTKAAVALAGDNAIARYNWKHRGPTPIGYTRGMAAAYAIAYAGLKAGEATSVAIAAPITKPATDVLAHYEMQLRGAGLDGAPRLRQVFTILWGLGPRESSGRYCVGRDMAARQEEPVSDTTETGLFQQSYNLMAFSPLLKQVPVPGDDGLLSIFREGVSVKPGDLQTWGNPGPGLNFQRDCKAKPLYAVMTAALGLRFTGGAHGHWGPIRRHEAEVVPGVAALLAAIEALVDAPTASQGASPAAQTEPPATQVAPRAFPLTSEAGVRAVQARLIKAGYLDPPADGLAGRQTNMALGLAGGLSALPDLVDLPINPGDDLAGRVVKAALARGDWIPRAPGMFWVAFVEGTNADGTENDNRNNVFNDRALIIEVAPSTGVPKIIFNAEATTEPSRHWTINPMHPGGAFHIDLGQQKAWVRGKHHGRDAWVQARVMRGTRDPDKTFKRDPRHPYADDDMGVNIHWGYDLDHDNMGNSSAGCLVIRMDAPQRQFMAITTSDVRYRSNPNYTLMVSVLPQLSTLGAIA